ncbi:MAG TPA: UvrD-helicase domain-containing protein, partial [Dehalococcoidia bacterium]|nr:UvrD-helicase domain-containing protein [Dehalococcoidia bacterium]
MTTPELELHRARDERTRRLIREELKATLFVEAGAGTGKTRALVDRYVAHVLDGARVDEILAITFTEKAAAELRDRVRGELERRAEAAGGDAPALQIALASLDRAQISTIHAFALNVLRSFAAEQGIDPSFGVHDEVLAERRFQERWRSFLEDAGRDPIVRDAVSRALSLGLATRDIERLAHELWRNGAVTEMLAGAPLQILPAQPLDLQRLRATLQAFGYAHVPNEDKLRVAVERTLAALDALIATPPEQRDSLLAAVAPTLKAGQIGNAPNWGGKDFIEPVREALDAACEALTSGLAALRSETLGRLLPVAVRFVTEETRSRLRDGDLLFDDLILQLRNILLHNADARRRLRATYKTLLIDEFQDTDPLQVDIAEAFARDPDTDELEAGRLFLVGDPKQSIYRFRRADMGVYAATRSLVLQHLGQVPQLALNRRSRKEVLHFVNATFDRLIGDGAQPSVQPPYRPVHAEREEYLAGPGVAWIGRALEVAARDARRHEALQVAARCREVLEQGWEVWERDAGIARPARYRDIAILVPTRTILQPLERSLATAGVPYRVEGGSLIYATQEVRDLINFLSAIDDSTDDVAVVATLRSPAYACSDVDLARHRLAGGSFNYLSPDLDEAAGRVAAG